MTTETTELQTVSENAVDLRTSAGNLMMNIPAMENLMRVAEMMASGKSTVPLHLQKNPSDCMAVCMQAAQWGLNPFAVAQKTHVVSGALGYESQLVNAVVQTSGTITGRFHYEYRGNSPSLECRVGAVIRGESEITWGNWLNESKVTTKNSPLWKTNPQQQMGYLQVKNWARLYCPGAILGVYSPDEFDQPQPRNMGTDEVVQLHPVAALDPAILEAAQEAADNGVTAYGEWWAAAGKDGRKAVGAAEHERLRGIAVAADKARTVNSEVTDTQPKTDAASGEVTVTFDQMIQKLNKATSEDGLYVAMDWSSAMDDQSRITELEAHFEKRLSEIRK